MNRPFFLPALSTAEAIARIYSLTGAAPSKTRGEKQAILALRDALGLNIDTARTNAVMGALIAEHLRIDWHDKYAERNKVNLDGLNALLEGATDAYHEGSLRQLAGRRPDWLDDPKWLAFEPALSKIEAVNRISLLTNSGPEWLGPGSKEHKSVLLNLAKHLTPHLDPRQSKTKLGRALAEEFGASWNSECESTGETISLKGLNTILAGAELRLGRLGVARAALFGTPEAEGTALAAALLDGWAAKEQSDGGRRVVWDGKKCIQWMVRREITNGPNHTEWFGYYFEHRGREILNSAFAPNPNPPQSRYDGTPFDYSLRFVWDLKGHTESWRNPVTGTTRSGRSGAILNDQRAMDSAIEEQGLGFLMLSGVGIEDQDGAFKVWHDQFKRAQGKRIAPSNSGNSRGRKVVFEPLHIEAFFFHNTDELNAAKAGGQILGFRTGRQAPKALGEKGAVRKPKYSLAVQKARRTHLRVARFDWTHTLG